MPAHKTLFIPNVTTDVGLSPPYNSLFTFFGQFFDHGVDQTVKSGGTVFVPLQGRRPAGHARPGRHRRHRRRGSAAASAFMVLTRAQNQPGPDGVLGTADDVQNANNTDTPWVDQSQTYTSHSSHQVFLREYALNAAGQPGLDRQAARRPRRRPDLPELARRARRHRHLGGGQEAGRDEARPAAGRQGRRPTSRCSRPTRTASSSPARPAACRST